MPSVYITAEKRQIIILRACGRCEYCQSRAGFATETFAVEHITPLSRDGTNELDNLALACSDCNGRKYNKIEGYDPITGTIVPLFHPRKQRWNEHFAWSDDYTQAIGLTPTGRATIDTLHMNRIGLVNIRTALLIIRKHPPGIDE